MADFENILKIALEWAQAGERVAIATVTQSWGSSPRPAGSRMAMTQSGRIAGSVSGGCIEAAVFDEALAVITNRAPKLLDYGVADETAWAVGLACGGRVQVFIEPLE